ncbi:hypothetical protein H9635_05320 [Solibacillus sp. A46]|uniref:Uncharacterized protein n=1 Tax=Solibacillus faecavium TaxID=2762221 RepID=A0ABR8XW37_9BACL|nr:hypothetical protein [Solibacillus faecavium]MBD8036154.1 hypothetical protein [Solibacillus faecavium]
MVALRQTEMDFIAGQVVSETIEKQGNALIETVAGMDRLKDVAKQYINCAPNITQGRMFEIIETTKFNAAAAKAGSLLRAVTTEQLGEPHAAADIFIRDAKGEVLKEIQAKSYNSIATTARAVADAKYNGMERLVNVEKEGHVKELIEKRMNSNGIYAQDYRDAQGVVTGKTSYENITSGGTTYDQSLEAAKNTEQFAKKLNRVEFISGASNAMLCGALAGAFIGGTVSMVANGYNKEFSVKETGKAALNSGSRSAVIGGVSYGIKFLGKNNPIMNGNIASALASSAVNMTELTYKFLSGKISIDAYVQGLGSNAVSCFSGILMTAAGAALFGPIGAAVAGSVALIGMKQLYKVFQAAHNDLALAKETRVLAEQMAAAVIEQVKQEEQLLVNYYNEYTQTLKELKVVVDMAGIDESYTEKAIIALADGLNIKFEYNTLEEFTDFMLSDDILKL